MKTYEPKYWNGKGKYQELHNELRKKLVPIEGEAETERGEILRIVDNWYYDIYNNGGCNHEQHVSDLWKLYEIAPEYAKNAALEFGTFPTEELLENENFRMFLDRFVDWAVIYAQALESLEGLEKELE